MRKPILSRERFLEEHRTHDERLKRYLLTARGVKNRYDDVVHELKDASARSLLATNTRARLTFFEEVQSLMKEIPTIQNAGFVTLAPASFAMPASQAATFDHEELLCWGAKVLDGFDFVGMVDLAYYSNFSVRPGSIDRTLSWHLHVIVWNFDPSLLIEVVRQINDECQSLISGRTTAHIREIRTSKAAAGHVAYMMKAPLSEYRIYPDRMQKELIHQRKRPLRPADALKIYRVLSGRRLPSMMLSGGAGTELVRTAETNAEKAIRHSDAKRQKELEAMFGRVRT